MRGPEDEGTDPGSTGVLGPVLDNLPLLVPMVVIAVLVLAVAMVVRSRARRRSSRSVEHMWREGTMDDMEMRRDGPADAEGGRVDVIRAYCAFCGHRHETPEATRCEECGRDRAEG
jgi:hypothetical protein